MLRNPVAGVLLRAGGVLLGAALAAGPVGCGEEPPTPPVVARPVKLFTVGSPGGVGSVEYSGEIRPVQQADMAFEVPGKVIEFPVDEGQPVSRGTVLARLDPRDYEQKLEQAAAMLRQSKTDMERYEYLYEQGVNPRRDYELRQRNYEVAKADHEIARKALEDTVLRAPFDGVVARKLVEDFVNVQAKEPVLILQDASQLKIRVNVPERDFAGPRTDESLDEITDRLSPRVTLSAVPDRSFPARLTELATSADPTTRTYQATLTFEPPEDVNVLPGMTARVSLDTSRSPQRSEASTLRVPSQAVVGGPDGAFVWRVDEQGMTVHKAPVEVGSLLGDEIEIRSGLKTGETIATSGVHQLREGSPVRAYEP